MEDKSSNTWLNYFIGGKFILFDGENKLMNCNSTYVDIFDLNSQSLNTRISLSIDVPIQERAIYSSEKQIFIGNAKHLIGAIKYDSESNIETEFEKEIIISPNPTNNFVNIELNCIEQLINYQINDVNGLMIYQSSVQNNTGNLLVDFTSYPVGVYFVSIECNNLLKTYKIVKEG